VRNTADYLTAGAFEEKPILFGLGQHLRNSAKGCHCTPLNNTWPPNFNVCFAFAAQAGGVSMAIA
jgi:hypothetical protein